MLCIRRLVEAPQNAALSEPKDTWDYAGILAVLTETGKGAT